MNPAKVHPGRAKPENRKPHARTIRNCNDRSLGELIRRFDIECRKRGHNTREAAILRAAINKYLEVGDFGLTVRQENAMNVNAIKRRFPIHDSTKQRMVDQAEVLLEDSDAALIVDGLKALLAMEKANQADEHHAAGSKVEHAGTVTIQAADARQEMLKDPDYLEYLRTKAMETQPKLNGVHTANGTH